MLSRSLYVLPCAELDPDRLADRLAGAYRVVEVDDLRALPRLAARGAWLAMPLSAAASQDERARRLISAWRVILLYGVDEVLAASDWFGLVEAWSQTCLFAARPLDILTVAEAGYGVWPHDADIDRGLLPLRHARLRAMSGLDRTVLDALGAGTSNRQIARRLGLGERQVGDSLRRSMRVLHVQGRLQAAVLVALSRGAGSIEDR